MKRSVYATEEQEQITVIVWRDLQLLSNPTSPLHLLHAIPNGGKRDRRTAARLKAQGVKPGVHDLFLPHARGPYHGLYIEMKRRRGGKISKEQHLFFVEVSLEGYLAVFCNGAQEAIDALCDYLRLPAMADIKAQRDRDRLIRGA